MPQFHHRDAFLDSKVVEMIRGIMFDPEKLARCLDGHDRRDHQGVAHGLVRVAGEIKRLDDERRRIIELYATEKMTG
jgi:hypothetical protein